jgi:hypothetical protein
MVGVGSEPFAFSELLAMVVVTHLFMAMVCFSVLSLNPGSLQVVRTF